MKTSTKAKVPELRFPEFEGEWEKRKLKNIANITTGNTPSTSNKSFYDGKYLFVSPADLNDGRYVKKTKTTLTKLGFENGRKIKKNSVLFVSIGSTIGKVGQAYEDCITNQQINSLDANENNSNGFIYSLLSKKGNKIKRLAGVQAVPLLNKTDFSNLIFIFPQLPEQQKIAAFLSQVDRKIDLLQQKVSALETYKKGVMQQLFSQQLRFKQDDGSDFPDWEFVKGSKLFSPISNKNHNSELPILAVTQDQGAIPRDLIDYNIGVTPKSISTYKVVERGDFIISLRSFQGGIEYSNYKGICSPAYLILRSKKDIINIFYKNYFKTSKYITELNKKLEGIRDGKMISYKYFSEIDIPYPSIEEQTKIANFLSSIDQKIRHTQQQLEQTQSYKKGLLQKLFV